MMEGVIGLSYPVEVVLSAAHSYRLPKARRITEHIPISEGIDIQSARLLSHVTLVKVVTADSWSEETRLEISVIQENSISLLGPL